jgi:hypothetical protein
MRMQKVAKSKGMRAAEARFMIDCGRASRCTRGSWLFLSFENSAPPLDRLFVF